MAHRRLILVDDHRELLEQVSVLLAEAPGIEVVSRYTNGSEAVQGIVAHQPDAALIDLELPDMPGAEVIQRVKARGCLTACLVLTHFDDDAHLFPALRAGAVGYVVKTPARSGLLKAIQDVLDGEVHMSARLARRIFRTLSGPPETIYPEEPSLTKREREILEALGKGDSPKQVAAVLFIDYETVRSHLRHIYAKLEVHSRYEALAVFRARRS